MIDIKRKQKRRLGKWLKLTFALGLSFFLAYVAAAYLVTFQKDLPSKHLLIEGWLNKEHLEQLKTYLDGYVYDSLFIVGMDYKKSIENNDAAGDQDKKMKPHSYSGKTAMLANGCLEYIFANPTRTNHQQLEMGMYGTCALGFCPHYNIFVNGRFLGSGLVTEKDSTYIFEIPDGLYAPEMKLTVFFDNDMKFDRHSDRNLVISAVALNGQPIEPLHGTPFYTKNAPSFFQMDNNGKNARQYLLDLGLDTLKTRIIETGWEAHNKTFYYSRAAGQYLNKSNIPDIKVITAQNHSRRTYLSFRGSISPEIAVGCIYFEAHNETLTVPSLFVEAASCIWTWVYWLFH
jgi:hypothetical protein